MSPSISSHRLFPPGQCLSVYFREPVFIFSNSPGLKNREHRILLDGGDADFKGLPCLRGYTVDVPFTPDNRFLDCCEVAAGEKRIVFFTPASPMPVTSTSATSRKKINNNVLRINFSFLHQDSTWSQVRNVVILQAPRIFRQSLLSKPVLRGAGPGPVLSQRSLA